MKIGELALASNLSTATLRYYEKRGLIRSSRAANGYRDYDQSILVTLQLIEQAKALGFTLNEISAQLSDPALLASPMALRELLERQLEKVENRIIALQTLKTDIADLMERTCPLTLPNDAATSK